MQHRRDRHTDQYGALTHPISLLCILPRQSHCIEFNSIKSSGAAANKDFIQDAVNVQANLKYILSDSSILQQPPSELTVYNCTGQPFTAISIILFLSPADFLNPVKYLARIIRLTVGLVPYQGIVHRPSGSRQLQRQRHTHRK